MNNKKETFTSVDPPLFAPFDDSIAIEFEQKVLNGELLTSEEGIAWLKSKYNNK